MIGLHATIAVTSSLTYPSPDVQGELNKITNWVFAILGWGAGIAFIAVGAVFCFAYFGGRGSPQAIRALAGVSLGCVLISGASGIVKALLA